MFCPPVQLIPGSVPWPVPIGNVFTLIDQQQKITRHDRLPPKELAPVNIISPASLATLSTNEVSCDFLGLRWPKLCATCSGRAYIVNG